jgi:drug/metabolite transporter (DMT)-like permease
MISYRLVKRVGASRTSVVTYLLPPSALFWGVVVLHEHPSPSSFLALGLILGGVFLITRRDRGAKAPAEPIEARVRA